MRLRVPDLWQQLKQSFSLSLYIKCGTIFLLFALSVLVIACGSSGTNTNIDNPVVTVTINLGSNGSPTPPLPAYSCNAWVTNTTPSVYNNTIAVYAKYTHNVNGNPEGIGGASAQANVLWPDGNTATVQVTTTGDGLAVFPVSTANRSADMNKIVLVTVSFNGGGAPPCTVGPDQAAFFTLIIASPGANGTPPTTGGGGNNTPTTTPPPIQTNTPTPTRTPKPTKTPKGGG